MASRFKIPDFKTFVEQDIKKCFLNITEFAEEIEYNGQKVQAVIDNNDAREPKLKESDALGVYKWERCLHINVADLPYKPEPGEYIRLNGGEMQCISHVEEEIGMYLIYLAGNMR